MGHQDDDSNSPSHANLGALYDDNPEDSTMEISLKDIYALSQADRQSSSPQQGMSALSNMMPPPAPLDGSDTQNTVELEEELIELDDEILSELTSEVYDEKDYDLVQQNFQEIDEHVDPIIFHGNEESSSSVEEELANTGVIEQSYEDLLLGEMSFAEEDTDPSLDVYIPFEEIEAEMMDQPLTLGDAVSLSQEDPSEAFDSMEELSQAQFDEGVGGEEPWVDSTSVFAPDPELLDAARGMYQEQLGTPFVQDTQHMIEVPVMPLMPEEEIVEDQTGLFEVPASLLSQLRGQSTEDSDATVEGASQTILTAGEASLPAASSVYGVVQPDGSLLVSPSQLQGMNLMAGTVVRLNIEHVGHEE